MAWKLPPPEVLRAACDALATPVGGRAPLKSLAKAAKNLEPCIKERMPAVKGLAPDPLDAVAYANPLGYLPELRALIDRGADEWGLLRWTARMEMIAVYATARLLETVTPERSLRRAKSVNVGGEDARFVAGHLVVRGDVKNNGVLVVLGDLSVGGAYLGRSPESRLVVLGDLEVHFGDISGGIAVRGEVRARGALCVSGHGSSLFVGGRVTSPLLVREDKSLRAGGVKCAVDLDDRALRPAAVAKAKRLLKPALVRARDDDELPVDLARLRRLAGRKQALFR